MDGSHGTMIAGYMQVIRNAVVGWLVEGNRAGMSSLWNGHEFWTCSVGKCRFLERVSIGEQLWEDISTIGESVEVKSEEEK